MTSCKSSDPDQSRDAERFARLAQSHTLRDGGLDSWRQTRLGIAGAGLIGSRLAVEAVRSGVDMVVVCDFDVSESHNLGNQIGRAGIAKVDNVVAACDGIRSGHARGFCCDVRHAGIRQLAEWDVLVDCTDDPNLARPLTEISNGLGSDMLRLAVSGDGEADLCRALASNGGRGDACQLCPYSLSDLARRWGRVPCPGQARRADTPPTLAGGGIGAAAAGLGLLLAQRLVAGRNAEAVRNHEIILDLTHFHLHYLQLKRSDQCPSGHVRWTCQDVELTADDNTLGDLFAAARARLHTNGVRVAAYLHPFNVQAVCACGALQTAAGTDWAPRPTCLRCGAAMAWLRETQMDQLTEQDAARLGILQKPLIELGIPDGALWLIRSPGRPLERWLLQSTTPAHAGRRIDSWNSNP